MHANPNRPRAAGPRACCGQPHLLLVIPSETWVWYLLRIVMVSHEYHPVWENLYLGCRIVICILLFTMVSHWLIRIWYRILYHHNITFVSENASYQKTC